MVFSKRDAARTHSKQHYPPMLTRRITTIQSASRFPLQNQVPRTGADNGSFDRTVLETLPLMRRRPMLDATFALGNGTERSQVTAVD